jgi:hypothetical protein
MLGLSPNANLSDALTNAAILLFDYAIIYDTFMKQKRVSLLPKSPSTPIHRPHSVMSSIIC